MNDNRAQQNEDEFTAFCNILSNEDNENGIPLSENGEEISLNLENGQQLLTTEQLQALGFEAPQSNLQHGQQAIDSQPQLISDPLQVSLGQASTSFSRHDTANREAQHLPNLDVGQGSSIPPTPILPTVEQTPENVLEWGSSDVNLGQASSELQHLGLPNSQQVANEVPQNLPNLSLEQAHMILQGLASRTDQQAVPSGRVQHPLFPSSSGLQPPASQSTQQAKTNTILPQSQNLGIAPTSVNHSQTPDLWNPNLLAGPSGLPDRNHIATPDFTGGSSNGVPFLPDGVDFSTFPAFNEMQRNDGESQGYLGRNHMPDEADNGTNAASDQIGLRNQQDLNSGRVQQNLSGGDRSRSIPTSTVGEVNLPINAIPQVGILAYDQTRDGVLQVPNQHSAALHPQLPLGNDQRTNQHHPNTSVNQHTFDIAPNEQAAAALLPNPQLQNGSNILTGPQNLPGGPADEQILNLLGIEQNVGEPLRGRNDTQGNNVKRTDREQKALNKVVHGQQYSETLQWISSLLAALPSNIAGGNEPNYVQSEFLAIPAFQDNLQRPSSQGIQQGSSSEQRSAGSERVLTPGFRRLLGSSYPTIFGREEDPDSGFSSKLTRMRHMNTTQEEVSKAIAVPELPSLDEEMVLNSNFTGFDTVSWRAEECNSPTISEITKSAKPGSIVPVETIFNYLFRLSRRSFLHREERVHLELTTMFLEKSRVKGGTRCERDVKELICWLEWKFNRSQLAGLVHGLVFAADETLAVRLLVGRAKTEYNARSAELSRLAKFFELVSTMHDITEMNKTTAKLKQGIEKSIKQARKDLKTKGLKPPKGTYEKRRTEDDGAPNEMDEALIKSFGATKRLLVDCTDSHYAYAQSVVRGAKVIRNEAQVGRGAKLEALNEQLSNLEEQANTVSQDLLVARTVIIEEIEGEMGKDMDVVEGTLIKGFLETVFALCKVTVSGFLHTIGDLPRTLALTLEDVGEELEKMRGIGSGEEPGVDDVVAMSRAVEEEKEKHAKQERILERKKIYLEECQQQLKEANAGEANAGGSNADGANADGANASGANAGGSSVGGSNVVDSNAGGSNAGGSNVGGSNTGGAPA